MDFTASAEERELCTLARDIFAKQVSKARFAEVESSGEGMDMALWHALAKSNLLGVAIAEAHGGMGHGFAELCALIETAGYHVAPVPLVPVLVTGALPVQAFGSDEQQRRLLGPVATGEGLLTAALIEPEAEDPRAPTALARPSGDGWVIDGVKMCVPFADRAGRMLCAARASGDTAEGRLVVLLVDPRAPGVTLHRQATTAGEPQFVVELAGVRVAADDVLAGPERGASVMDWLTQRAIVAYCAMQVGISERAMRLTAAYTSEREQFCKKLSTFQAVSQRAANCYIDISCLRLTTLQAISRLAAGDDAREDVAVAKIWAGDTGHRVSHAAQHLHGGIGVSADYELFRYCLWSKQIELTLGSSAHHLEQLGEMIATR